MPTNKVVYQNLIDIGIFIYLFGLILKEKEYEYNLIVGNDDPNNINDELVLNATYVIK